MLSEAASCVRGQSKLIDEYLNWTSDTLSVMTTNFSATLTTDVKVADSQLKEHLVSIAYLIAYVIYYQ